MASIETISTSEEISPRFQKLLRGVSDELSPEELRHAVSSIKTNFRGKFEDQGEQDLYSCLQLFAKQGLVSEDNLTLLEGFLSPKASKKKSLKEKIQQFKKNRQQEVSSGKEEPGLTGRERDLEKVMAMLTTGSSRVVNLHGISGVGKTKLAIGIVSKWPGRKFKADFREITEMKDVHFHVLNALAPDKTNISFEANLVVELMQQLRQAEQNSDILLFLDNVDKFAGGDDEASTFLNANFVKFLQGLLGPKDYPGKSKLKILLTSRSTLRHAKLANFDNYEVMALEKISSSVLFQNQGIGSVREDQMEKLLQICQGNPLIIKGMAAILRQQITNDTRILETIEQPLAAEPPESGIPAAEESRERDVFDSEKEGIDKEQESCLRKMFFFLPSKQLKDSAISMSLFCRSFSVEAAAEVLGVDSSEAVIQLEGLRNSEVLAVDLDVKELTYDIHPLVRTFLRSIGSNQKMFVKVYEKAKGRFHTYFMSKMIDISRLLDKDYMNAFDNFDLDKPNFELALDISFKSDHLLIPKEHRESVMIFYLFEAMLDEKARKNIFNCWAEKVEDDGKEGSLLRAELKCRETLLVLKLEGWQRALTVARRAKESLSKVQKETKSTDSFRLTKSSYLFSWGEVYYRAGNMSKSLRIFHKALKIMENELHSHTSTSRCLNGIGNCHNKLGQYDEAIKYYMRAYDMRQQLSGSVKHFDMPFFKGQIGTVYEGKKQFEKAIEYYKEALELAKELKIPGMVNTAQYNRNIANAYCWLQNFKDAYQPAKNAYETRKAILGRHPDTARSAFQMAQICRYSEDSDAAKEFYEQAWEIEKSLGQGNHSEVMVRIVESSEGFFLEGKRKDQFRQEVFDFFLRYWDEERAFEGFEFSLANKTVIDSINERLGEFSDRQTQERYQKEALWFYEGAWNSPDARKLPDTVREEILQTLCRLCKQLHEKSKAEKYSNEAFRFYEKKWKKNKVGMSKRDRIDILTTLVDMASTQTKEKKKQKYKSLLKKAKQSGTLVGTVKGFLSFGAKEAEQLSSEDDDDDDEVDIPSDDDDDDDDLDSSSGSEEIPEASGQVQQLTIQEEDGEELEREQEQEPDRIKIHEDTVTVQGGRWDARKAATHLVFPRGFVAEDTLLTLFRLKSSLCCPPLQPNEAIVSSVLELSADTTESLLFNKEVTLGISHSALDLKGYEVVIKTLVDRKRNEWKEVEQTVDYKSLSDLQKVYHNNIPDYLLPVAETKIIQCSTFAVVCRLKSYIFTITSEPSTISLPDFPLVKIHFPPNSVSSTEEISVRVQEYICKELKGKETLAGPIIRISCNKEIKFQEAVTVQLPLSLRDTEQDAESLGISDLSLVRARVLFQPSSGTQKEWTEITDLLDSPPWLDGFVIKFNVKHFSGFWGWLTSPLTQIARAWNTESVRHSVVFTATVPVQTRLNTDVDLLLYCSPHDMKREHIDDEKMVWLVEESEWYGMVTDDRAYVFFSGDAAQVVKKDRLKNFFLRFDREASTFRHLPMRVVNKGSITIEFYKSKDQSEENKIGILDMELPPALDLESTPVKFLGIPVDDRILHEAPLTEILPACKGVLEEIGRSDIHESHLGSDLDKRQKKCSFYRALASLPVEHQRKCHDAIIRFLKECRQSGFEGFVHIEERLIHAAKDA